MGSGITVNVIGHPDLFDSASIASWSGGTCISAYYLSNYVIFCPFDNAGATNAAQITFTSLMLPWYIGASEPLTDLLVYGVSSAGGNLVAVMHESQSTSNVARATACKVSSWTPVLVQNTVRQ
jgi:hypothetical protein